MLIYKKNYLFHKFGRGNTLFLDLICDLLRYIKHLERWVMPEVGRRG